MATFDGGALTQERGVPVLGAFKHPARPGRFMLTDDGGKLAARETAGFTSG